MNILTGNQGKAARLSLKDADLGLPLQPGRIVAKMAESAPTGAAPPFGAAPGTGSFRLRAPVHASGSAMAEFEAFKPLLKNAFSAIPDAKGLVKIADAAQSGHKMFAAFSDRHSPLHAKVGTTAAVVGDLVGVVKATTRLGDNAIVQVIGYCATATGMLCNLLEAADEKPKPLFGIGSAT